MRRILIIAAVMLGHDFSVVKNLTYLNASALFALAYLERDLPVKLTLLDSDCFN